LWLAPGLILIVGLGLAFVYMRRLRRTADVPAPLSRAEEERVARLIEDERA